MLVCHCHRVTDREVRRCVQDGASSVDQVARMCRAGSGCGGCKEAVTEVVDSELERDLPQLVTLGGV